MVVLGAVLKIGTGGSVLDNGSAGGIVATIDLDTGIVSRRATGLKGEKFEFHPDTNRRIVGVQIPAWQEVIELCKQIAMESDSSALIGWDVAVSKGNDTNNYVIQIVEGNENPGFELHQIPSGEGLAEKVREAGYRIK